MSDFRFFKQVLPTTGNAVLTSVVAHPRNTVVPISAIQSAVPVLDNQCTALYFSISTFPDGAVTVYEGRTINNMHAVRSFVADVDCGKPNAYATPADAMRGLKATLLAANLPTPTIVSSGGGFHLYWSMVEDMTVTQWRKVSVLLAAVLNHTGLLHDRALTVNPVVLLRPPGATHRKDPSNPRPVVVKHLAEPIPVLEFAKRLMAYVSAKGIAVNQPTTVQAHAAITLDLGFPLPVSKFEHEALVEPEPLDAGRIVKECKQIRECADSQNWRHALTVLRLCTDGENWCHEVSSRGETYDAVAVDKKLANMSRYHSGQAMPALCATFDRTEPGVCQSCPHWEKVKSPVVLGREPSVNTSVIVTMEESPPCPECAGGVNDLGLTTPVVAGVQEITFAHENWRFRVDHEGMWVNEKSDNGENWTWTKFCPQQAYPIGKVTQVDDAGDLIYAYLWRVHAEADLTKFRDYVIPAKEIYRVQGGIGVFADYGIRIETKKYWEIFNLMNRQMLDAIASAQSPVPLIKQLGWTADMSSFCYGAYLCSGVQPKGVHRTVCDTSLRAFNESNGLGIPVGDFQLWKDAADVFALPGQEYGAVALGASFGSPLLALSSYTGAIVHYNGQTGFGKSAIMRVAAAIWGNPKRMIARAAGTSLGDTLISLFERIATLNNLPVCIDEITELGTDKSCDFIYSATQGNTKTRMQQVDGRQVFKAGRVWSNIFMTNANGSLIEKAANSGKHDWSALAARVLEFDLPAIDRSTTKSKETGRIIDAVSVNYGHAGAIYAQWLVANKDKLTGLLNEEHDRVLSAVGYNQEERFQTITIAAIVLGLRIARAAALVTIDPDKISAWMCNQMASVRVRTNDARNLVATPFADMMSHLLPNTLVLDGGTGVVPFGIRMKPRADLAVRVELDTKRVFVSSSAVKDYAREHGLTPRELCKDAVRNYYAEKVPKVTRVTMARGVPDLASVGVVGVYEFTLPDDMRTELLKVEPVSE